MKDNVQSKLSYLNFNITTKDEVMCDSESIEEFDHMVVEIKKKKKNGWSLKYMETVKLEMIK